MVVKGWRIDAVMEADSWEVAGVNSRIELAEVEAEWQRRRRLSVMRDGATLIAPETVFFSHDTLIGQDVLIEPNVVFGPGVALGSASCREIVCQVVVVLGGRRILK